MKDYQYSLNIIRQELECKYLCPEVKYALKAGAEALEKQIAIGKKKKECMIGQKVIANSLTPYKGLLGEIIDIKIGDEKETDNEGDDIYVRFICPSDYKSCKELERRFSKLNRALITVDYIAFDEVIMFRDSLNFISEEEFEQIYIYNHYGYDAQMEKLKEECLELTLAIQHKEKPEKIIEEMADVENVMEMLKECNTDIYNGVQSWKKYKVNREIDKISQDLQNKGFKEESKGLDCKFDL